MVIERYRRRLAGHEVEQHYTFRLQRNDGQMIWLELSATPFEWENQPATLSFITDVSHRRLLEERLTRSLRERDSILESTLIGIGLIRKDQFEWVNRTLPEMFGFTPEQVVGRDISVMFGHNPGWGQLHNELAQQLGTEQQASAELPLRRVDGSVVWVRIQGTRIRSASGQSSSLWCFVDITDSRRAIEETEKALARERELNVLKSRFVSMTSHEFRTPLASILSSIELLRHYAGQMAAEDREELFDQVESSVERMTQMLDNILLIGRADANRLEFNPRHVDLKALCEELVAEAECTAISNDAVAPRIAFTLQGVQGEYLLDPDLMRHIFGNLLSNAVKYSPMGGTVHFRVRRDGKTLHFTVADEGIGIPESDREHLFESFHRGSNVGSIAGTGLGLSIVRHALALHGGRIRTDSTAGKGTTFEVSLDLLV